MRRNDKGFTLVELIIVIAVIGVLAAILIPVFSNVMEKANAKSALTDARNTVEQAYVSAMSNSRFPKNLVIFVKKAGNWYVYGFNLMQGGRLRVSSGNPYRGYADIAALNDAYGWNQAGEPDANGTYSFGENMGFYLVSSADATTTHFRSIGTRSGSDYVDVVSEYMQDAETASDAAVRQGILLPGTWYEDDGSEGGTTGSGSSETGSLPPLTITCTVKVSAGSLPIEERTSFKVKYGGGTYSFNDEFTVPAGTAANSITVEYEGSHQLHTFNGFEGESTITDTENTTTLTALWTLTQYYTLEFTVGAGETFNPAPGFTNGDSFQEGTDIKAIVTGSTASKANHAFSCWKKQGDDVTYGADYEGTISLTADTTFVPQFDEVYTITFEAGDGTGDDFTMTDKRLGEKITLPDPTGMTKAGYVFKCWEHTSGVEKNAGADWYVTGADVFTAQWTKNVFTVHYDGSIAHITSVPEDAEYAVGTSSVTISGATADGSAYYYVKEYATTLDSEKIAEGGTINTSAVTAGTEISVTPAAASMTVTIHYVTEGYTNVQNLPADYTISLATDPWSYTIPENNPTADEGSLAGYTVTSDNVTITSSGYGTDGKYLEGNTITFSATSANNAEITLQGTWMVLYTLSYNANGGLGTMNSQSGLASGVYATVAENSFTREGYTFKYFTTTASDEGTHYRYGGGEGCLSTLLIESDTTLYAQWAERPSDCTVTYHPNGATHQSAAEGAADYADVAAGGEDYTVLNNTDNNLRYNKGTSTGRVCEWNTQADGKGTAYKMGDTIPNLSEDVDLYAVWSWDGTWNKSTEPATDTSGEYLIYTPMELVWCAANSATNNSTPWSSGKTFKLMNDIYLNLNVLTESENVLTLDEGTFNEWKGFSSSFSDGTKFCGQFYGQGHTIYGVYMTKVYYWKTASNSAVEGGNHLGFFPTLSDGAEIHDVKFADCYVMNTSKYCVGGVAGYTASATRIENVEFRGYVKSGTMVSNSGGVGGILGKDEHPASAGTTTYITNCTSRGYVATTAVGGTVNGSGGAGGILGHDSCNSALCGAIEVTYCKNFAAVTHTGNGFASPSSGSESYAGIGGIVGKTMSAGAVIEKCENYGKIGNSSLQPSSGTQAAYHIDTGGILGLARNYVNQSCTVRYCKNAGMITGSCSGLGGIVGGTAANVSVLAITDCYNIGEIYYINDTGNQIAKRGGIVGEAGTGTTITNCYNAGSFTFKSNTMSHQKGYLINCGGTRTNCFYLDTIVNCFGNQNTNYIYDLNGAGATAKTATEFQSLAATLGAAFWQGAERPMLVDVDEQS